MFPERSTTEVQSLKPSIIDRRWTTSVAYVNSLLYVADKLGVAQQDLLLAAEIPSAPLDDPEARLPMTDLMNLFRCAVRLSGEEDFALHFASHYRPWAMGILGYLCMSCSTIKELFDTWIPYRYTLMHAGNTHVEPCGEHVRFIWEPLGDALIKDRYLIDAIFAVWVGATENLTGRSIKPLELQLTYSEPADTTMLHELFGDRILFDQPYNTFVMHKDDYHAQLCHPNPEMKEVLITRGANKLRQLQLADTTLNTVEEALLKLLPHGRSSIDAVADQMQITPRTLQRRLRSENTAFSEVLKQLRHRLANTYLTEHTISVTEIALLLGYRDTNSLTAAFRQWEGCSPTHYRIEHAN